MRDVAVHRQGAGIRVKHVDFISMFVDEARLAARIRGPNVVPTLDVVTTGSELFLVMEYVARRSGRPTRGHLRGGRRSVAARYGSTSPRG